VEGVHLEPWAAGDLALLERIVGDPAMMEHLGGAESPAKIAERQARYEKDGSAQYKIVDEASGDGAGWVGYWVRGWRGRPVYEIGWSVLPSFQGRGFAGAATADALEIARSQGHRRFVHAFPSVDNAASNAVCRKTGFTLLGDIDFEFPPGHTMRCNDWGLDLLRRSGGSSR
jgi:RimJ/RimL family protein N-acetyltransferase